MPRKLVVRPIKDDPYHRQIIFVFGSTADINAYFKRKYDNAEVVTRDSFGQVSRFTPKDPKYETLRFIIVQDDPCVPKRNRNDHIACLVHELVHAVMSIFDSVGVPISKENQEAFAYYMEWLTVRCLRHL